MARVFQLKPRGTWYADIRFPGGIDKKGKRMYVRRRLALSTDRRIAEEKLWHLIKQRNALKHHHVPTEKTYEAAKERFVKIYSSGSKITLKHYLRALRNLEDFVAPEELVQITPDLVTDLYLKWKEKGRGLYVRNRDRECIISFMHRAESWKMVEPQDWDTSVKSDPEPRGRLLFYSPTEFRKILRVTHGPWESLARLGYRAGLRPGEMFWLEWRDVDLENRKIHIEAKPQYAHHVRNYERRSVPIPKDLLSYLSKIKRFAAGDFVASCPNGRRPKTVDVASTYFSRLVRKAGLKGSMYTLRHSYGAALAQAGIALQVIRDLMGHRTVTTTEIYAHLIPAMHEEAVARLPPL